MNNEQKNFDRLMADWLIRHKLPGLATIEELEQPSEHCNTNDFETHFQECLTELFDMKVKDEQGNDTDEFLFDKPVLWHSVYRVSVDHGFYKADTYTPFVSGIQNNNINFRIPVNLNAIKKGDCGIYHKHLKMWNAADIKRINSYNARKLVAETFENLLKNHGLTS